MDFRAPLIVFCVVMGRRPSPIYSSIAYFLLSYGTFGGVLGVACLGMLPLYLSFGPTWAVLHPSLLLSMLPRLLAHHSLSGICGWSGMVKSSKMFGLALCIFGERSHILFRKVFK